MKWINGHIAKERKISEDALARNQEKTKKPAAKGSSKGITVGKAVVQLRTQENNWFRLQHDSVVTNKKYNL